MSKWIVELEPGVFIAPIKGDPGRTLCRENATIFTSQSESATGADR